MKIFLYIQIPPLNLSLSSAIGVMGANGVYPALLALLAQPKKPKANTTIMPNAKKKLFIIFLKYQAINGR